MTPTYDYRISNGASAFAGGGSIQATNGSPAISGSGTSFLFQAHPGDLIIISGNVIGSVKTVTDSLNLVLYQNYTGTSTGGFVSYSFDPMVNVETLVPAWPFAPRPVPKLWQQDFDLGNGLKRGLGGPSTAWDFGFVTQTYRDALRVYCPGSSANVWIRSRGLDNSTGYLDYSTAMLWPIDEPLDALRRVPFAVLFRAMVIL